MMRQQLVGMSLEVFLAEVMAPPGKRNYNVSRYILLEGELDVEAWIDSAETTLLEAGAVHYDYVVDGQAAWRVASPDRVYKVSRVDLHGVPDAMKRCLEAMQEDTKRAVPLLSKEDKIRVVLFALGQSGGRERWIYYHRYHHILIDGYSGQELLLRRIAERYNARVRLSQSSPSSILGYDALLEEDADYTRSSQCDADKAFWAEYLGEYVRRTRDVPATGSEKGTAPLVRRLGFAGSNGSIPAQVPIASITAGIMTAFYRASGVAWQMIGMTFMRRKKGKLARVISPMSTILPVWAEVGGGREHGAVAA